MKLLLITLSVIILLGCDSSNKIDPMPNGVVEVSQLGGSLPETYVVGCLLYQEVFFNFEVYDSCGGEVAAIEYSIAHDRLGNYIPACKNESYGLWQARLWLHIEWPKKGVTVFWRPVYLECGELVRGEVRELNTSGGYCSNPDWSVCQ